jgi:hypothetical protein
MSASQHFMQARRMIWHLDQILKGQQFAATEENTDIYASSKLVDKQSQNNF